MGLGGEPAAQRVTGSMLENFSPQHWQISQGWISLCACCSLCGSCRTVMMSTLLLMPNQPE